MLSVVTRLDTHVTEHILLYVDIEDHNLYNAVVKYRMPHGFLMTSRALLYHHIKQYTYSTLIQIDIYKFTIIITNRWS